MSGGVAAIILQQLGGQRFIAMTGASGFYQEASALQFSLPANLTKHHGNKMRIELEPSDTYRLTLYRIGKKPLSATVVEERFDIYHDNLQEVFTRMTGLATSL